MLESRSFETGYANNAWNPTIYNSEYFNKFEYDAMGNILTQKRHARDGTLWEDLTYNYDYLDPVTNTKLLRNRLFTVNDAVGVVDPQTSDLGDQSPFLSDVEVIDIDNNYRYDAEGRLKQDVAENIEDIIWRVDGKVKEIVRISGSSTKNVIFDYDAMGNRIAKHVYDNSTGEFDKSTYYILDAQGNTISTYDHEIVASDAIYNLKERHIYGSSRLGVTTEEVRLEGPVVLDTGITGTPLGLRYYELSNHLGNVLTVINDIKIPQSTNGTTVDGYQVGIVNVSDYSPFGVQLDGRTIENGSYRYGFNGMEKDDEISGSGNSYTTYFRQLDPRVGRWKSIDPVAMAWESPYVAMNNNPIVFTDVRGDCPWCGFFSGVLDAAIQIVDIATDPNKSYKDFSVASVATSFVAGLAGAGIANNIKKLYNVAKLTRRTKAAITVATQLSVDTGVSVAKQKVDGNNIDVKQAVLDAVIGQTVGKTVAGKVGKYVKNKSSSIQRAKDQLNKTPKGPKGTKTRNKLNRKIDEIGDKLDNGARVQGAVTTATGIAGSSEEKLETKIAAIVPLPDGYGEQSKPIGNGMNATWKGNHVNGKLRDGAVYIFDSDNLLKSISIVKSGRTVDLNATIDEAKEAVSKSKAK